MDRFIDCLIDNDLKQLIISGTVPDEELQQAWDKIYVQQCEISQDGSYNQVFELSKEINDIRAKITIATNSIQHLEMAFDQDIVDLLNTFALRCNIIETDSGQVLVDKLNAVVGRMKKWFPKLKLKESELEAIRKNNTNKIDRAYFDDWLDIMSEAKGYHHKPEEITVTRFYRSMGQLIKKAEKEQLKNNSKNRKS